MTSQCSLKNNTDQVGCGCSGQNSKRIISIVMILGMIGVTGHYFFGWF